LFGVALGVSCFLAGLLLVRAITSPAAPNVAASVVAAAPPAAALATLQPVVEQPVPAPAAPPTPLPAASAKKKKRASAAAVTSPSNKPLRPRPIVDDGF
jgi:hypothetical protein